MQAAAPNAHMGEISVQHGRSATRAPAGRVRKVRHDRYDETTMRRPELLKRHDDDTTRRADLEHDRTIRDPEYACPHPARPRIPHSLPPHATRRLADSDGAGPLGVQYRGHRPDRPDPRPRHGFATVAAGRRFPIARHDRRTDVPDADHDPAGCRRQHHVRGTRQHCAFRPTVDPGAGSGPARTCGGCTGSR